MKTKSLLLTACLLLAGPVAVQAQFYCVTNNGTLTITGYTGTDSAVAIPGAINGLTVTGIRYEAFYGCWSMTSVAIPDTVTNIGYAPFEACGSLTAISVSASNTAYGSTAGVLFNKNQTTLIQYPVGNAATSYAIPNGVTCIGTNAFGDCASLANITLPNGVACIGDYAFWYCAALNSVTIPGSVTYMGYDAFSATDINSLTVSDGATSIGPSAFFACPSLATVTIPASVTNIGSMAFGDCGCLTLITVNAGNSFYSSVGGVLFDKRQTTLLQYPIGVQAPAYSIPIGVTSIGDDAFWSCLNLASVTIPTGVTNIGDGAFDNCQSLTNAPIPEGVINIGDDAFWYCFGLTNGTIPDSVTSIGNEAFDGCSNLTSISIGSGVTNIGSQAFEGCSGSTNLTLPGGLTSIGDDAFAHCSGLTNITIPGGVTSIGFGAFADCALTNVTIPAGVTNIGFSAFGCAGLTSISVAASNLFFSSVGGVLFNISQTALLEYPLGSRATSYSISNRVTDIGYAAFSGCSNLTSVPIPAGVTNIEGSAFAGCSLVNVIIPATVTGIGDYAFSGCDCLADLMIGSNVGSIGADAFFACAALDSVTIPASVTNLPYQAFAYCLNLSHVCFEGNAPSLFSPDAFSDDPLTVIYYVEGTEGWGATNGGLPTAPCVRCLGTVPAVQFTASVTNGQAPLAVQFNSSGTDSLGYALTGWNWYFGDGATSTSQNPAHTYTAAGAFAPSLVATNSQGEVVLGSGPQITAWTFTSATNFTWTTNRGAITLTGYTGAGGAVHIPSAITGLPVNSIANAAFDSCSSMTSVTIPAGVTNIGLDAFASCSSLASITVDASNTAFCSVAGVLFNRSQTVLIQYPGGSAADAYTVPGTVTTIGQDAFNGCFLFSVTIPGSVTCIGTNAFYQSWNLTNVTFGAGLADIEDGAFGNCFYLSCLTIPASLTTLGAGSFADCYFLTNVCFEGDAPTTNGNVGFAGGFSTIVYYVVGTTGWGATFGGVSTASCAQCAGSVAAPLVIASAALDGANLVLNGMGGVAGGTYCVLASTDLALPLGQWTCLAGNVLNAGGNFTITVTNAVNPRFRQRFYLLQTQ